MKKLSHGICENCRVKSEVWDGKKYFWNLGTLLKLLWSRSESGKNSTERKFLQSFVSSSSIIKFEDQVFTPQLKNILLLILWSCFDLLLGEIFVSSHFKFSFLQLKPQFYWFHQGQKASLYKPRVSHSPSTSTWAIAWMSPIIIDGMWCPCTLVVIYPIWIRTQVL